MDFSPPGQQWLENFAISMEFEHVYGVLNYSADCPHAFNMHAALLVHFFLGVGVKTNESCRSRSIIFVGGRGSRRNMSPVSHLSSPLQLMNLGNQKLDSATWPDHEPLCLFITTAFIHVLAIRSQPGPLNLSCGASNLRNVYIRATYSSIQEGRMNKCIYGERFFRAGKAFIILEIS